MTIDELHEYTEKLLAAAGIDIKYIEKEELNSKETPKKEEEKTENKPQKVTVRFIKKINP